MICGAISLTLIREFEGPNAKWQEILITGNTAQHKPVSHIRKAQSVLPHTVTSDITTLRRAHSHSQLPAVAVADQESQAFSVAEAQVVRSCCNFLLTTQTFSKHIGTRQ